jgi:hypothetical protein
VDLGAHTLHWTFEKLPDQPIAIQAFSKDYNYAKDGTVSTDQMSEFLDRQSQPVIYIVNILEASFSLDDLIGGINVAARQRKLFQHPNLRETVVVTQDLATELALKGMSAPIFGGTKIRTFKTFDQAMEYAQEAAQG